MNRSLFPLALLLLLTPLRADAPIEYGPPQLVGDLTDKFIRESSGIVASRRNPGVLWTHNDSGDKPVVYALGLKGETLGSLSVLGAANRDWEDIAAATIEGEPYLVLAEVGDNDRRHSENVLYLVKEPVVEAGKAPRMSARVDRVVRFVYPGGPRDVEAVAVDPTTNEALVMTKVILGAASVYSVPLSATQTVTATHVADVFLCFVTGMDISPDGRRLIVCTYGPAYEFTRSEGQSWAEVFKQTPRTIRLPKRKQGEAICYGPDGRSIYLTSEGSPCPLWLVPVK